MFRRHWPRWFALVWGIACVFATAPAEAEVAVFSNRTRERLTVSVLPDGVQPQPFTLEVGESRPVFYQRALSVRYQEGLIERTHQVAAKSAYFFTRGNGDEPLRLEQIGFAHNMPAPSEPVGLANGQQAVVIPVKILVDDDEPTHRQIWEATLRKRVAAASDILERHSGVKLNVVAVGMWDSDDRQHDFSASLREFEKEVTPHPGQLAIGFSSQYNVQSGRVHMGGTRGALHPYILLKERSRTMLDTERLELLVHELGHFLGASHSPEPQSVMRPLITSSLQRQAGSRIGFDPVNTLLVAMLGDEIRSRGVKRLADVSRPTRTRMGEIYGVLAKALPNDPAAGQYLQLLTVSTAQPAARAPAPPPMSVQDETALADTRRTLVHLVQVIRKRRPDASASGNQPPADQWYAGDKLTEFYVRQAALAAVQLEPQEPEKAFLLSLGIFLDESGVLLKFPATAAFVANVEPKSQRESRLSILGSPTMRDRRDLAQHFFLSAYLTATMGPQVTLSIGLAKEMKDADGGTGFSFIDLTADRAGIAFAQHVAAGKIPLEELSQRFTVADYLPPVDDLVEGLQLDELKTRYGELADDAFQAELKRIETRILGLPVYNRSQPAED